MNISRHRKKVLFILGMHRSGTSALAGCVQLGGVSGGSNLLEPSFDNEKGFFENRQALNIDEAILAQLGLRWDSLFDLPEGWIADSQLRKYRQSITHFLTTELSHRPALYIKDPRLSYLLPLWLDVMAEMQVECACAIAVRHPAEVYHSLRKRDILDESKAISLWLNHLFLAEKNSRGTPRRIIFYNDLLEDPAGVTEQLLRDFELLPSENDWQNRCIAIQNFIEKKLRHHEVIGGGGIESQPYSPTLLALLEKLAASPGAGDPATLAKVDMQRAFFQDNLRLFTPGPKNNFFATLKLDCGEKTRMVAPLRLPVFEGLDKLVFNLSHLAAPLQKATLFPCDTFCHVALGKVHIAYTDGSELEYLPDQRKVLVEHGDEFLFNSQDFILVVPEPDKRIESITFQVDYKTIGEASLEKVSDFVMNIRSWFSAHLAQREAVLTQEKKQTEQQTDQWKSEAGQWKLEAGQWQLKAGQFEKEMELLHSQLETEKKRSQNLDDLLKAQQASMEDIDRQLLAAFENLSENQLQLVDLQKKIEAGKEAFAAEKQAHEATKQTARTTWKQLETARVEAQASQRELEIARQLQKQKDELVWELFSKNHQLQTDYRQALATLEEERSSVSNRLGRILTAPGRWLYDFWVKKPFNQTRLWLFLQFLAAALRMPGRLFSQLNRKNFNTLRKALKNESPREIAENLRKLLTGQSGNGLLPTSDMAEATTLSIPSIIAGSDHTEPQKPALPFVNTQEAGSSVETKLTGLGTLQTVDFISPKKTVLFASPHLPDYDGSSGGKRATRLLELLAEDCEVYAFTLGNKDEKHVRKLEAAGVRVFKCNDFQEVRQLVPQVDALIFSFFYTYFDCGEFLRLYSNAKIIVDSVDVHWVRHERSRGMWAELTDDVIQRKKTLEIEVYRKADIIWAVTEQDRQAILHEVPGADVRIVSNVHECAVSDYRDPGSNDLLFFGGFAHYPNILAVKELTLNLFPKIRQQVEDARLLIAGSNAPPEVQDLGKLPGVEFLGFVEESQLIELYRNSFLAIAPLQAGAGIKGKICEAIAHRVPVVTNSIGNEGIELENEVSGLISDDEKELVRLTVKALRRECDLEKMTARAQEKIHGLVGAAVAKKNMMGSLSGPEISICIVTWNKLALLQRCIESIENHTIGLRHKILVHSNGCTDGTQEYLAAAARINPDIVPILSKTNDVFVIPNNRMMQLFPENDVVLLNNDTYVTPGWLEALQEAAYSSPEIGIAGAKLLYPDGILQEFGSELYANGTGRNIGKGDDPNHEAYSQAKYVGYVSGCAFYVKRETIGKIGVFDEAFHPCYCEDSDYCYTAWEQNIATIVTPQCVIYHDEGGTSGTDTSSGFKAYQRVNFEKFLKKHGGCLEEINTKIKLKNLTLKSKVLTQKPSVRAAPLV